MLLAYFFYVLKILFNITFAHDKAVVVNFIQIFVSEILFPTKRNVTALNNKVLLIFNGSFLLFLEELATNTFQFTVIFGGQVCIFCSVLAPSSKDQSINKGIYIFQEVSVPIAFLPV